MTRNEVIQKLQELTDGSLLNIESWAINPYVSALTFAVNILKQSESNDLISRQAAIDSLIDPLSDDGKGRIKAVVRELEKEWEDEAE